MNTLYKGDNLSILKSLPDASVDLIATDPPFFTQKDWGAFSDKWTGGLNQYLKFMEQRAIEMHRVLKDTGSLYLHCDPTASHYLKVMLDGVFGIKQFRNEIVWSYRRWSVKGQKHLNRTHDIIFWYTKTDLYPFNVDELRLPYSQSTINRAKYPCKYLKKKKINNKGRFPEDVISHIAFVQGNANENQGYPTQKPVALYERIIKASSNQNDTVLDPFAGSGTTLDASQSLGRHWIGIDQSDEAINVIQARLRDRHALEYDRDYQIITQKGR